MVFVYVINNQRSGKIYIGQTEDLESRLKRHNEELPSKSRSYTRINKGEWILAYKENLGSRKEALVREKYFKSHIGRDWLRRKILGL